jgi:predicted ATPase
MLDGGFVGRNAEAQLLKDAYQRVLKFPRSCEAILVHGESGTGKTYLVRETFRRQHDDGTIISGKFDIIHVAARPYSAIVDALTQLCSASTWNNISNEEILQTNLHNRLSPADLNILSKLAPAVDLRLASLAVCNEIKEGGDDNEVETGSSLDQPSSSTDNAFAFARFAEIVRSFLFLVARYLPSPLILFLDDVQAADAESLSLISSLTSLHSESCNLLLILAYRDTNTSNDDEQQIIMNQSSILSNTTVFQVTDIQVGNLDADHINKLMSKLLRMDEDETYPLSQLITQRTGSNIYMSVQFIEMLKKTELVGYSFDAYRWEWNLDKIRADTNVTDTVALLLTSKIKRLSPNVQLTLRLAACLGFYFDIEMLEQISKQESSVETKSSLENVERTPSSAQDEGSEVLPTEELESSNKFSDLIAMAVDENLIEQTEDTEFKFTHDRVFQAVYETIPSKREKDVLHWRIGRTLWTELQTKKQQHEQMVTNTPKDWLLFATADQLNRGLHSSLMNDDAFTPLDLSKLFLEAGKAALEKSAFKHAARFFDRGVQLMKGKWQSEYPLCLELHTLCAEAEYAGSNFENCDHRIDDVLSNGRCLEDKLRVYLIKVQSQGVRGCVVKALDESAGVLRLLGERVPRRPNILHLLYELTKTKRVLNGRSISDLAALLHMTNTLKAWAVRFLQNLVIFSWYAGNNESLLLGVLRMMQLTVKFGVSSQGPFVLASYGLALGSLGDLKAANEAGRVALELTKRPHTTSSYSCAVSVVFSFLYHLKHPVIHCLDHFLDGYNSGIKSGDIEGAALCLSGYATLGVFVGKKLDVVASEMEGFRQTYRDEFERNFALMFLTPWHQFALSMMGQSAKPGDLVCEEAYTVEVRRTSNEVAKATLSVARMILLYLMGDFEGASKEVATLDMNLVSRGTHFSTPFILMYAALTMLAMARKTRMRRFLRRAKVFEGIMQKFKKAGNLNMPPLLELVSAEQVSLRRRIPEAEVKKAYTVAVRIASQSGLSVVSAIGNERAGEFMASRGDAFWAETFLSRACLLYDEWGATTKTKQLKESYVFLAESGHISTSTCQSVSVSLRKRYSYKAANESRRLSRS